MQPKGMSCLNRPYQPPRVDPNDPKVGHCGDSRGAPLVQDSIDNIQLLTRAERTELQRATELAPLRVTLS